MKTSIKSLLAAAGWLLLASGCSTDDTQGLSVGAFEIAEENLEYNFAQAQEIVFIPVRTNIPESEWKIVSSDDSWCKVSRSYTSQKGLQLAVTRSEEPEVRSARAVVSAGGNEYTISVRQLGYGPAILVSDRTVPAAGGSVDIDVTANIEYTVGAPVISADDDAGWIEAVRDEIPVRAFASTTHAFFAQANLLPFERRATIAINAVDPIYAENSVKVTVSQSTQSVSPGDIPGDKKLAVLGARANQISKNEGSVEALYDGDYTSYYHSPWAVEYENPTTTFPVVFEFRFDGTRNVDFIQIMHRGAYNASTGAVSAGNGTGAIGKFNVWASTADDPADADYVLLTDEPLDLRMAGGYQKAVLPVPAQSPKWVKLEVLEGSGDNGVEGGFVTPAEIEFFASPKAALDEAMLEVFTDLSCSELREGVTRTEITRLYGLSAFVAQEAAMRLMNGTYDPFEKEFRAATYLPYSDNNLNRRLLTKKYSRMDNPTGIEVKPGEKLIVCVDKVPAGQRLSLAVFGEAANGYGPNYGGMAEADQYETVDQEVTLTAGLNAVDITAAGMCYVMNTAAALSSASEAVKVHILPTCGTVHGYFDLERHRTDERYVELLARTGYKYFVAKGRKMIFNFHTSQLRADAPTGIVSGLTAWDDIVSWQQELMGIDECDYFNNHIMAVSTTDPDAYMDASNRRVSFSTSALHKIISREQLNALEDNTWGPAHELGHVNQGAINWKSTTESSNNLFSNYAIYKMGKYESRGDALSELALSWSKQETWVLMGASTHQGEDTEAHMRMNWQLWNYYHRCGYNERFFPVLFELLRQDPLPSEYSAAEDPGASQLKFAEKACDAAQEDLTEFFETWGFYRPVDITYEQYGSARYRVTEAMIRESKARIAAKGYPKAAPIQYLEDRKVKNGTLYSDMGHFDTYRNKTQITKTPSFTLSGRTYTVADCDQAVAVELRKPASGETLGELLYFSNLATFTVPDGVNLAGAELYAVQYDGARKPVR